MMGLGAGELLVIFVLALIFIGPKKLPELAKGLGKGIREFQKAKDGIVEDFQKGMEEQKVDAKVASTPQVLAPTTTTIANTAVLEEASSSSIQS